MTKLQLKAITSWIVLLPFFNAVSGQATKEDLSSKLLILFDKAKKEAQKGNLVKSNKHYEKLLKAKPDFAEGGLRMASNWYHLKEYQKAESGFKRVIEAYPDYDPEMYYSLGMVYQDQKKYLPAAASFDEFVKRNTNNPEKKTKAASLRDNLLFRSQAMTNPVPFNPENVGNGINTNFSEYSPSLSLDGGTMIFTRNIGQEDFYISYKDSMGNFGKAMPLISLNSVFNDGAHAISADGTYLVFTSCDRKDAFGSCDLYFSIFENGKWTIPVNMGHKVNSAAWDSQPVLSPDGRTLLFSSRRLGTLGGNDLWMTWRNEKNAWVTPVNLGPQVNSAGDDETPFLHPDGMTLYFRSNGRVGMGNFDIYVCRRNDIHGPWGEPENIGYPINSEGAEGAFVVSLEGKKAYFSSDSDYKTGKNMKQLDIYSMDLYERARPRPSTFVKGKVFDAVTGKPLEARITVKDLTTGNTVFEVPRAADGWFISGISTGINYICIAQYPGYRYYSQNFDLLATATPDKPYILDIRMDPVEKIPENIPVVLHNIFFNTGSAELLPESVSEIDLLVSLLKENPLYRIKITGHTDNVGSDADNIALSVARAKSVADALKARGIDNARITYEGKGESAPVTTNDTEEGRRQNRRTEYSLSKL